MMSRIMHWVVLTGALVMGLTAGAQDAAPSLEHMELIKRGDTVLWIGDGLMENSDWPRFVEAALLAGRPDDGVTWYRAGTEGSTAQAAALWGARIVMTVRASLVIACFGQEESQFLRHPMPPGFEDPTDEAIQQALETYEKGLDLFVESMLARSVRTVVIVSPPAVDELEPASHGFYVGVNATLAQFAERARVYAERRSLPYMDLYGITLRTIEASRADGQGATTDGRAPTEIASTVIAAEALEAMGMDRESLARRQWRPSTEPAYENARRIDPTLSEYAPGEGAGSFAIAQALDIFDMHFRILWRDLDQNLHPEHSHRADILSKHRAEVDGDWRRVRGVVEERRALTAEQP